MSTDKRTLTPQSLAQHLITSGSTLEELVDHFAADAQLLTTLLYSHECHDHLKLRTDLAVTQARLQAAAALPACIATLRQLTHAEKPEVARRAIMALIGIAGVPTRVAPAAAPPPTPTPEPEQPPEKPDASDEEADEREIDDNQTDQDQTDQDQTNEEETDAEEIDADPSDEEDPDDGQEDPELKQIRDRDYGAYLIAFDKVEALKQAQENAEDRADELARELAQAREQIRTPTPTRPQPPQPIRPHWIPQPAKSAPTPEFPTSQSPTSKLAPDPAGPANINQNPSKTALFHPPAQGVEQAPPPNPLPHATAT